MSAITPLTQEEMRAAVPPAVRAQLEAVEAEVAAAQAEEAREAAAAEAPTPEPGTPPEPTAEPATPAAPATPEPAPAALPPPDDPTVLRARLEKVTQQLSVLHGKYQAEVPRLHAENRALRQELDTLRAAAPSLAAADPLAVSDAEVKALVKPEQIEAYGIDYWRQQIELFRKLQPKAGNGKPVVAPVAPAPAPEAAPDVAADTGDVFFTLLESLVPDWRKQNEDAGFLAWLKTKSPLPGRSYNDLLQAAAQAQDASAVAELFNLYRDLRARPVAAKPSVAAQRVPVAHAGQPAASGKTMLTLGQYEQMQDRIAKIQFTNPGEAARLRQELDAAQREGRIVG